MNFPLVQQQPAGAEGIPVENIPLFVRTDVHSQKAGFPFLDFHIRVLQISVTGAEGLYLCAAQLDAVFDRFDDEVVVPCFFVLQDCVCVHGFLLPLS